MGLNTPNEDVSHLSPGPSCKEPPTNLEWFHLKLFVQGAR